MKAREVVLVDGIRTAYGRAGEKGFFWHTRADDMVVKIIRELLRRNPQVTPEMVESAVTDAKRNCLNNAVKNCRFVSGDIRDTLAGIGSTPDVMIIDPPRDGMHKDIVKKVLDVAPERIVYVSCNPSTLARDLGMMKDVYQVREVQPVDLFPHTFHIESVASLAKIG